MEISGVWEWVTNALQEMAKFGQWLMSPLQGLNMSPLAIIGSVAGITVIVGFLVLNLINFLG